MTRTLELYLYHGRFDPNQEMDEWGFDGPRLTGITKLSVMYGAHLVWFISEEAAQAARQITGWDAGIDPHLTLELPYFEDMVECQITDANRVVRKAYFGDWCLGTTDSLIR
jgi:hypothetical protein